MLRFAIGNLCSRPLRSTLSILGLAVAIGGMVGLFSIAGGIDRVVSQTFKQIPGLLVQQKGAPIPLFSTLPANWRSEIEAIPGVGVVDPEVFCRVNQLDDRLIINPPRFAVGMDINARLNLKRSIYRENLTDGRFLDLGDVNSNRCFISREIASSIQKGVGDSVAINGVPFEIVGIYDTGSLMLDVNMLMDIGTCRSLGRIDINTVGCFYVEPDGTIPNEPLQKSIENYFRGRNLHSSQPGAFLNAGSGGNPLGNLVRGLHAAYGSKKEPNSNETLGDEESRSLTSPGTENEKASPPLESSRNLPKPEASAQSHASPIEVRSADDWGKRIAEFSQDLNVFLFLMTAIGVSIATLSIVNTMMMSVTERTTEFGILRANGWARREIIRLMTLESGLIGFFGGIIGAGTGWLATLLVNWNWPGRLQLHAGASLLVSSLLFSILLGLAGGIYPAWRASRLSPMESIRRG